MVHASQTSVLVCRGFLALALLAPTAAALHAGDGETAPARDPKQAVDEAYTAKIKEYTTA